MTELLSVAPQTMTEDEHVIAKGYKQQFGIGLVLVLTLGLAAYFLELKWVVATGCVLIVGAISYCEARLYDLCIRLKRGNHLAHENGEKLAALLNKLDGRMNKLDERIFHIVNAFDIESRSANKTQKETDAVMADLQRLSEGRLPYRGENPASPPPRPPDLP